MPGFDLCIPTLNGGPVFRELLRALRGQTVQPDRLIVVDSGSTDGTAEAAGAHGAELHRIARARFDHGGTRRWVATELARQPLLVFLTQDAVPADPMALERLVAALDRPDAGAAYGRQLPRQDASAAEAFARGFNYPPDGEMRSLVDRARLGLRVAFLSNSFAAWRRSALEAAGGFPAHAPFGEDTIAAGRLLLAGWTIVYEAEAAVVHSHALGLRAEWRRYREIGRLHAREAWLRERFGAAEGEGLRYVLKETLHLLARQPWSLPGAWLRDAGRYIAYRRGLKEDGRPDPSADPSSTA